MNSRPLSDPTVRIHPTAIVSSTAQVGRNCVIEAYASIGDEVVLHDGVHIKPFATVTGRTEIGEDTTVYQYACVGEIPQDLKYAGEKTRLIVGKRNSIREGATLNTGTTNGGGLTCVGNDCLFMTGSHVGHDATVGNNVVLANQVALGGHSIVEDGVRISGLSGVHQFVRIGREAFVSAVTLVRRDVIPFGYVDNPKGELTNINYTGLIRSGVPRDRINELKEAFLFIGNYRGTFMEAIAAIQSRYSSDSLVQEIVRFCRADSKREFLMPKLNSG